MLQLTLNPIIGSKLIDLVFNPNGFSSLKNSVQWVKDKMEYIAILNEYFDRYNNQYGKVKVLGMNQGIPLESIYTPVKFLDKSNLHRFSNIQRIEEDFGKKGLRRLQMSECREENGISVANQYPYLMILGSPGSGKSTFLRRLGFEAFKGEKGEFEYALIPVFLELKYLIDNPVDLISVITNNFNEFGFQATQEVTKQLLSEGKLLVLLDGLDEVPQDNRNNVINAIEKLVASYSGKENQNRFIVSCRTAAYNSSFNQFVDVELADFNAEQIQYFISNWFASEEDKKLKVADKCWETLNNDTHKAAKELAQTPLLLTMICLVYNETQDFPDKLSPLYEKAFWILIEKWAAEKRVHNQRVYDGLNSYLERAMLADFAYQKFVDNRLFFKEEDIVNSIQSFLADSVDNPKYLDGKYVLDAIAIQQGILIERADSIYSFSHLTIQEYLTAHYISQNDDQIKNLVANYLEDTRWKEVFLLVAGLKDSADKLLMEMQKIAYSKFISTDKLKNLLSWVEEMVDTSDREIKAVGKRAIVFANANAIANAIAIAIDISIDKAKYNVIANTVASINTNAYTYAIANGYPDANAYTYAISYCYVYAIANPIAKTNFIDLSFSKDFINVFEIMINHNLWLQENQIYKNINYEELITKLTSLQEKNTDINDTELAKKVIQILNISFHLPPEMLNLSKEKLKAAEKYLYANKLIIDYKQEAVRVSRSVWEKIERQMFLPWNGELGDY